MRIVAISSSFPRFKGDIAAPFVKEITKALAESGHSIDMLVPYDRLTQQEPDIPNVHIKRVRYIWPGRLHLIGHARSMNADVRIRPITFFLLPFYLLFMFIELMRLTARQNSELVHAHWVLPNGLVAAIVAKIRGLPLLISLHGSDIYIAEKNAVYRLCAKWIFGRADMVVACSSDLRDAALEMGASHQTSFVLPYGVDINRFIPKEKLEYEGRKLQVVSLGRMVHKKGFKFLIQAWKTVARDNKSALLSIGGDGTLLHEHQAQAADTDSASTVRFPGVISWDSVPAFLSSADLFVLPSVRDEYGNVDGLPNVLMEAMSCGVAVVASDVAGVPSVIEHGVNGYLVPPGDADALSEVLNLLMADHSLRLRIGENARAAVIEQHSWFHYAVQLNKFLARALILAN